MRVRGMRADQMIVYEDEAVLVVHKPPFLAVETKNPRQQDLVSILKNYRSSVAEAAYIGVVHRIDQPVEGLLVLAKTSRAAAGLSAGLLKGGFTKEYLAIVQGVTPERECLVHTLKKDGKTNTSAVVAAGTAGGKEARLSYERLAVIDEKSLLRIRLDTGRHHQIRVQLAAAGYPLWGDAKYADRPVCSDTDGRKGGMAGQPLALCSSHLAFEHPLTGKPMEFYAVPTGTGFTAFKEIIADWKQKNTIIKS